jgi:glycosyltransferase involved in cell wall biosynthesis
MRVLFALPGLHRYNRGAEAAFIAIASGIAEAGNAVTLIGSGHAHAGAPYRFLHAASLGRENFERFPFVPLLRNETAYEELTFIPDLLRRYRPADYDVTLTCGYPFTNWVLRHPVLRGSRPRHVFVTENGDWPAFSRKSEYRFFRCDGLVCTNPEFYERNKAQWRCQLIPNGVNCDRFKPGTAQRQEFGLPTERFIVLMVSALVQNKRIEAGIEAVSRIPNAHLVVAGDGPLRQVVDACAARLLPDRFTRLLVVPERMPKLYQSANVFLHLCKDESFGNVFLEAMACGLPVVAPDSSNVRWIVGNDEFLVGNDEPAAISHQIELARDAGPAKRTQRVAKAAAFSWTRIVEMYLKFLEEIVNSRGTKLAQRLT